MFRSVASVGGVRSFGLACAVSFRALGCSWRRARGGVLRCVVHCGARGSSQRGACRQRVVYRAQATTVVVLPGFPLLVRQFGIQLLP